MRIAGSASAATISGRVTVPSSRSVPRALPVRSGGPETSRTSSRSWKAKPDLGAEGSQRCDVLAEETGALEELPGLQAAAFEVALLGELGVEGVVALRQLTLGEGDRGVGEQGDSAGVAMGGKQREGARRRAGRRPPSRGRGPRSRRRSAGRGAAVRRRGRRRGRASPCGRARSRRRREPRPLPHPAPAQSRTSSGRSRLPPAARVASASSASSSPWPRPCSRSSSST